ncbi:hypothetical protein [Okeania sp. SIO3I5]|nr:hypothetical protein [Okeania sp. SIO3I5]
MWERVRNSNSDLVAKENHHNNTAQATRTTRSISNISKLSGR